ncbi:unnamed protein product, partial [Brassica oleracea var. botrytis]
MQLMSSDSVMTSRVQWRDPTRVFIWSWSGICYTHWKWFQVCLMVICLWLDIINFIERISSRVFGWKSLEIKWIVLWRLLLYQEHIYGLIGTMSTFQSMFRMQWVFTIRFGQNKMPKWHTNRIK